MAATARRRTRPGKRLGLLRALGVAGWDALEPAILAALATESPILLIGPHGTAKTLLLNRLAGALDLAFRHYNASILNFDDLLGYPVPQDGSLTYLQTPATIWEAEAVFFDEVSRCRPEIQNKLFPLIHERVAQGLPLERLRHRWAAMNPPPSEGGDDDEAGALVYEGAEPLDVALADRFAFVLQVPVLRDLSEGEQRDVLAGGGEPSPDAPARLTAALERCRELLPESERVLRDPASEYTRVLAGKLAVAGHPLSTRRAVTLARNIEALHAARCALQGASLGPRKKLTKDVEDSFYLAARLSVPDAAWGRPLEGHVLLGAHRVSWEAVGLEPGAPERALLTESRPLKRIALALTLEMPPSEAGAVMADAFSSLDRPSRLVTAAVLFPRLAHRSDLPASALEPVADAYATVATRGVEAVTVRRGGQDWKRELMGRTLGELDPKRPRDRVLQNAAAALMSDDERFEFDTLVRAWDEATAAFETVKPRPSSPKRRPRRPRAGRKEGTA